MCRLNVPDDRIQLDHAQEVLETDLITTAFNYEKLLREMTGNDTVKSDKLAVKRGPHTAQGLAWCPDARCPPPLREA